MTAPPGLGPQEDSLTPRDTRGRRYRPWPSLHDDVGRLSAQTNGTVRFGRAWIGRRVARAAGSRPRIIRSMTCCATGLIRPIAPADGAHTAGSLRASRFEPQMERIRVPKREGESAMSRRNPTPPHAMPRRRMVRARASERIKSGAPPAAPRLYGRAGSEWWRTPHYMAFPAR